MKVLIDGYPEVSIGVCARNCERTISYAIESVIAQSFPHELMEIIFIDDGSTDKTLSIIRNHASQMDINAKIFHQKWKGLGSARSLAVKKSKGKYIVWVDGDMIITKNFVKKQVEFMEQHPSVGIGKGRYGLSLQKKLASDLETLEFITVNSRMGKNFDAPGTGGAIYRVDALKEVRGFDEGITYAGEDTDVEYRIRRAGWSILVTPAIFYERRRETWRDLWNQYFWRGSGSLYFFRKKIPVARQMLWPPIAFLTEISRAVTVYRLTSSKIAFLLPLHYFFKRTAWIFGLLTSFLRMKLMVQMKATQFKLEN